MAVDFHTGHDLGIIGWVAEVVFHCVVILVSIVTFFTSFHKNVDEVMASGPPSVFKISLAKQVLAFCKTIYQKFVIIVAIRF